MPVSIGQLKQEIKAAFIAEMEQTDDREGSIDRIAAAIAEAAAKQIVQGINTASVVPVLTCSMGPVTGKITITASTE